MQHPEQMSRKAPLPLQVETSQLVKLCLAFFTEQCCGTAYTELTFVTSCRVMTGLGASALRDDVTLVRSCNEVGLGWASASAAAALAIAARITQWATERASLDRQRRTEEITSGFTCGSLNNLKRFFSR